MRIIAGLSLIWVLLATACRPVPSNIQADTAAQLPTVMVLPTETAVIIPTSVGTDVPILLATDAPAANPVATESIEEVPIATALQMDLATSTPTLLPSKTPTVTPTETLIPTITNTPTITATATLTPTSDQFVFDGPGQSSSSEATAIAEGFTGEQNPFLNINPQGLNNPSSSAPSTQCAGTPWFFNATLPGCPIEGPTTGIGVFQRFETGYMIWLESNDRIYVMYNTAEQPRWQMFDDPYVEGAPERDNAWHTKEQQPPQTWQPRRGFGEVWRQYSDVRFRIGWAVQEWETIYSPRYQLGEDGGISIEGPSGGVFYLEPRGSEWYLFRP